MDDVGELVPPVTALAMFQRGADAAVGPLVTYFATELTAADISTRANALARRLHAEGIGRGERIAILTQNDPAFLVALLAAWRLGGIAVPINPMYTERELAFLLVDTRTRAVVCLDDEIDGPVKTVIDSGDTDVDAVIVIDREAAAFASDGSALAVPSIDPGEPDISGEDPALLMYTSGTTGVPKAAVITHANLTAAAEIYRRWMTLTEVDVVLGVSPLFHITGLVGHVAVCFLTGAQLVLTHRFDPAVMLDAVRQRRVTFVLATVSALLDIVDSSTGPEDFASVRLLETGGAPVSRAHADRIEAATGTRLGILYGLTETTSPAIASRIGESIPVDPESGAMSIGVPVHATSCRVVDGAGAPVAVGEVGELEIRGPQVIGRYWHDGDMPDDGWPDGDIVSGDIVDGDIVDGALRTGDIGFVDAAGYVYLLDRRRDMITTAGYKVWPREVEEVLARHPAVAEAAVVGLPDATRGEAVTAFITARAGQAPTPTELDEYARGQLAAYKRPRRIRVVEHLPKSPAGKILRRELRDDYADSVEPTA